MYKSRNENMKKTKLTKINQSSMLNGQRHLPHVLHEKKVEAGEQFGRKGHLLQSQTIENWSRTLPMTDRGKIAGRGWNRIRITMLHH